MQVLCKSTIGRGETRCCVCGQGFVMFWERQSSDERMEALREIQKTLSNHHHSQPGQQAHPHAGFMVPVWNGSFPHSGPEIEGHAPSWVQ